MPLACSSLSTPRLSSKVEMTTYTGAGGRSWGEEGVVGDLRETEAKEGLDLRWRKEGERVCGHGSVRGREATKEKRREDAIKGEDEVGDRRGGEESEIRSWISDTLAPGGGICD